MTSTSIPRHLQEDACYVCGGDQHEVTPTHTYWANKDARDYFTHAYVGQAEAGYVEARYVDTYVGR